MMLGQKEHPVSEIQISENCKMSPEFGCYIFLKAGGKVPNGIGQNRNGSGLAILGLTGQGDGSPVGDPWVDNPRLLLLLVEGHRSEGHQVGPVPGITHTTIHHVPSSEKEMTLDINVGSGLRPNNMHCHTQPISTGFFLC